MSPKIRDFWSGMPPTLRVSLIAIGGSAATILGLKAQEMTRPKDEYWGKDEIRAIIRQEVEPLQAGFKAYVKTLPDRQQIVVLNAMAEVTERNKRAN